MAAPATHLQAAARHRKLSRAPVLAYVYQGCGDSGSPLWVSSAYRDPKEVSRELEAGFLKTLSREQPVEVFVCEGKGSRSLEESSFSGLFAVHYLELEGNEELGRSENALIGVFLHRRVPILSEVLNSKWYHYVARCLGACLQLRNCLLAQRPLLLRCDSGRDKSLLLAALLQVVLDPYYRTLAGFEALVMRVFVHLGHPFASRLGERQEGREKSPVFLQFLDCVSQLVAQNETSFEYNSKYLGSLANLMQLNIYGTFVADSPKEYVENGVEQETFPIWTALRTVLTTNSNYVKNSGVLNFSPSLSSLVLWREYFGSLISLRTRAVKSENEELLRRLKECKQAL